MQVKTVVKTIKLLIFINILCVNAKANEVHDDKFSACENGNLNSCYFLAINYQSGKVFDMNVPKAIKIYDSSCEKGFYKSCNNIADLYENGILVKKDMIKSFEYRKKACMLGNADACNMVAFHYKNQKNNTKAFKFFKKACYKSLEKKCSFLGFAYEKGIGVKKSIKKAKKIYKQSCDNDEYYGCAKIGHLYEIGKYAEKNITKAIKYYLKSCKLSGDIDMGCFSIKKIYQTPKQKLPFTEEEIYTKMCDIGYYTGCKYLVKKALENNNTQKALSIQEKNCKKGNNLGNALSCYELGMEYKNRTITQQNFNKSFEFIKLSCDYGLYEGCSMLGFMYGQGIGIEKNLNQSIKLWKNACSNHHAQSCMALGNLYNSKYEKNIKDTTKAKKYFKKACILDFKQGCKNYQDILKSK